MMCNSSFAVPFCNNQSIHDNITDDGPGAEMQITQPAKIVMYICCALVFIIGTVGNGAVIYIIGIKYRLERSFDIHIISLSIADLLSSIFVPMVQVHDLITDLKSWHLLGDPGCKIFVPINHVTVLVSSLTLLLVSVSRLIVIQSTKTIRRNRTTAIIQVLMTWVISFAVVAPYMKSFRYEYNVCFDNWSTDYHKDSLYRFIYHVIYQCIANLIPMSVMVIVYSVSIHVLYSHTVPGENQKLEVRRKGQNQKIMKMFGSIVIIFFTLTTPYLITVLLVSYYIAFDEEVYFKHLSVIFPTTYGLFTLSMFNCCINPFIYARMNKNVRTSFRKISQFSGRWTTATNTSMTESTAVSGFTNNAFEKT